MKPLNAYCYRYMSDKFTVLLYLIRASISQYLMLSKSVISSVILEIRYPLSGDLTLIEFTMGRVTGFSDLACHQAFQAN